MTEIRIGFVGNVDAGKCLGIDTPILEFKGGVKKVQEITIGDYLVGDDGKPRNVLSTTKGTGMLWEISSEGRESYIVNSDHLLTLTLSKSLTSKGKSYSKGEILDISVKDYLKLGEDKRYFRGYSLNFPFLKAKTHSINVSPKGIGEYYGFTLTGNGRFLLGDGTVTHNSSSISVLVNDILDDGRGSARGEIMHYPHERETGRTSSISRHHLITPSGNLISMIDLAGHEKYLKTTLRGLSTHYIDYAVIVVAANMGVSRMTIEHMDIVVAMNIPFIFLVTKIDVPSPSIVKTTVSDIISSVSKVDKNLVTRTIGGSTKLEEVVEGFKKGEVPIIGISNKSGKNVTLARTFLSSLESRISFPTHGTGEDTIFNIFEKFVVKGVGPVFVGYVTSGEIKVGMKIMLGPISGDWKSVIIKSIHDNFRKEILSLPLGSSGCVAVRYVDKKSKVKNKLPKGIVLTNKVKVVESFTADIYVFTNHSTTIKSGYEPIVTCNSICQTVILYDLEETVIRGGDRMSIKLRFKFRGEYISEGDLFMFREGRVKGIGRVTGIC